MKSADTLPEPILMNQDAVGMGEKISAFGRPVVWGALGDPEQALHHPDARQARVWVQLGRVVPDPSVLAALPKLELVASLGAGYDGLDVAGLQARGVTITTGSGANAADVADTALGLLLGLVRRIGAGDRLIRAGLWRGTPAFPTPSASMAQLHFGIVGMGSIGSAIAHRLQAFGCRVSWWGPRAKPHVPHSRAESLLHLAKACDGLILAAPALPNGVPLVDAALLEAMGPKAYLINVGRGSLVDQEALYEALANGRLAGAGLDVFAQEPFADERLSRLENLFMSPHQGGWAVGAMDEAKRLLLANIEAFFTGKPLLTPLPRSRA